MRIYLVLLVIFVAFNRKNVKAQTNPYYLGCFQDCYAGGCAPGNIDKYHNKRDIQLQAFTSSTSMTNEFCIGKCTSYGTFIYAATQNG